MIEPLLHRIVVKPENIQEFSEDLKRLKAIGLEAPEHEDLRRAQASVDRGIVVSIGPTAYRDFDVSPPVKEGDVVNYARFSGKTIEDGGVQYVVLNDEDCICIVRPD